MNEIDTYISTCPAEHQGKLNEMHQIIKDAVPKVTTEKISWQMPTFFLNGNLVHFALQKNHIGFYPGPSGIENFKEEFGERKYSKGAVQFPLSDPLPKELITKIVNFRVMENTAKKIK